MRLGLELEMVGETQLAVLGIWRFEGMWRAELKRTVVEKAMVRGMDQ
jgi:hypothetical protein